MKIGIANLCAIIMVVLVALGMGILIGAKRPAVQASGRFQKLTDTTALDTNTGKVCSTVVEDAYSGLKTPPGTEAIDSEGHPACKN